MGRQGNRESSNSFADETKYVLGGSAILSLVTGRETRFSNPNCHFNNAPMSLVIPYSVGSCQFNSSMGRFVISKWFTSPGLCIN